LWHFYKLFNKYVVLGTPSAFTADQANNVEGVDDDQNEVDAQNLDIDPEDLVDGENHPLTDAKGDAFDDEEFAMPAAQRFERLKREVWLPLLNVNSNTH
jgi:hypothetical protein